MRLAARLGKLERLCDTGSIKISELTDDDLLVEFRDAVEQLGIDLTSFKTDPLGAVSDFFAVHDENPLIEEVLVATEEISVDWLRRL